MKMTSEWIRFGETKEFSGFAVWPQSGTKPIPSLLVLQEVWGVDEHIEDVTRRFAEAGYVVVAPQIYAKNGETAPAMTIDRLADVKNFVTRNPAAFSDVKVREAELAKLPPEVGAKLSETFKVVSGAMQLGDYMPALTAASRFLRENFLPSKGKKVGAVGFCMGGGLASRLACHDTELAGAVSFYGGAPPLDDIASIACPILAFYGGSDTRVNASIPAFAEEMGRSRKSYEKHIYEGAAHAFFNDTRPSYHAEAQRDSYARTLEFFRKNLT